MIQWSSNPLESGSGRNFVIGVLHTGHLPSPPRRFSVTRPLSEQRQTLGEPFGPDKAWGHGHLLPANHNGVHQA